MKKHILVIDDDTRILLLFERMLGKHGFEVTTCQDGQKAIVHIDKQKFNMIICDLALEKMDGIELLEHAKKQSPDVPFIIITGYNSVRKAVESVKKGAFDYVVKPFDNEAILEVIHRAFKELIFKVPKKNRPVSFENIIGQSEKMQEVFRIITQIAETSATVLIHGESGTGKELIAKAIHALSARKNESFIPVNCGTLSDNLLENELFGHVQGAFTGAIRQKKGLLAEAHMGTLFLDEISETPLSVQTKLLRVLQEREFKPLGSNNTIQIEIRVITATNKDLREAVKDKLFREDLYYRLAVIPLFIPPLRARKEDISPLATHFAKKYAQENKKNIEYIAPEAMEKLTRCMWPGNVRELENTIARAVALARGTVISAESLWHGTQSDQINMDSIQETGSLKEMIELQTQKAISKALKLSKGNKSKAARLLGISRASLYHKIKKYHLGINE